jgi:predicted TIM-barrel fold metal-dependent hydrolase
VRGQPPRTRIDVHAHLVPDFYRSALADLGIRRVSGMPVPSWTPAAALGVMDRFGIELQILSMSEPAVTPFSGAAATAMARRINAYEAELIEQFPGRFGALAVLPLPDPEASALIAVEALDELRLDGIVVGTTYPGTSLGSPALDALWAELDARDAWVFVHPSAPPDDARPVLKLPPFLYEFTFETTRAITDLVLSGVPQRHPRIRWHLAHAGGAVPAIAGRLVREAERAAVASTAHPVRAAAAAAGLLEPEVVRGALGRLFYDTALAPAPSAMDALRTLAPLDHILFGTDWPYAQTLLLGAGDPQPELARAFTPAERRAVERANALAQLPTIATRLRADR